MNLKHYCALLLVLGLGEDAVTATPAAQVDNTPSAADVPFSELFAAGNTDNVTPTTADTSANTQTSAPAVPDPTTVQPTAPQTPSFEIKTSTGSVYKSVDDAVKGIEHKDTLINQLRQYAIQATGVDPVTGQQYQLPQQQQMQPQQYQQPQMQQSGYRYANNPQQYYADLQQAYQAQDPQMYYQVQQRLAAEQADIQAQQTFEQMAAPIMPFIQQMAHNSAVEQASQGNVEIRNFIGSEAFKATLQKSPTLAQAIQVAENDFRYANQLPELYRMVYSLNQAATLPQLLKQQQTAATTPQTARPTVQPTNLTPPRPANISSGNLVDDAQARKDFIKAFESSGKADSVFK